MPPGPILISPAVARRSKPLPSVSIADLLDLKPATVTRMNYFFLDTEWADLIGSELVSLALVSEDGTREFYAEIDPLPDAPTDFVRHVVYPLLDRGHAALRQSDFTASLRSFLNTVDMPYVVADYPNDLSLLQYAIAGFDLADTIEQRCGPIPPVLPMGMLKDGMTQLVLEDYFAAHPDARQRRHHALVDAHALRTAWLALNDRVDAPWSPTLAKQRLRSDPSDV
jgi:hypothetical protein